MPKNRHGCSTEPTHPRDGWTSKWRSGDLTLLRTPTPLCAPRSASPRFATRRQFHSTVRKGVCLRFEELILCAAARLLVRYTKRTNLPLLGAHPESSHALVAASKLRQSMTRRANSAGGSLTARLRGNAQHAPGNSGSGGPFR